MALTKTLRWDIQSLGIRLEKAATSEESSRKANGKSGSRVAHEVEIREIVKDMKSLLDRIEDAVPLINLAITTSGAKLTTTLPASVSPSRLLQASAFLNGGDTQYAMNPCVPVQIGPVFTLSLYMLFAGHSARFHDDEDSIRATTWKEVIHKSRVKLMRAPLSFSSGYTAISSPGTPSEGSILQSIEGGSGMDSVLPGEGKQNEYAYHLEIVEDLEDDRVHSFEDGEAQPGPYGDVRLAGIREVLPIHQISKIFYADTGKILNIRTEGETNNPILLLKRDVNALPPRRMMQEEEKENDLYEEALEEALIDEDHDSQDELDQQLRRESSFHLPTEGKDDLLSYMNDKAWHLPADLDPEWLALEVYTEAEDDSSTEDGQEAHDDSAYASHRPSSSGEEQEPSDDSFVNGISHLNISPSQTPSPSPHQLTQTPLPLRSYPPKARPQTLGPVTTSLSLLEMFIRLTALQQYQQANHLTIPDELLTFFLEESSTTGGNEDERRRTRREARNKVGFDPYDESPIKRRGEEYLQHQYQGQYQGYPEGYERQYGYSRDGTPQYEHSEEDDFPNIPPSADAYRRRPQYISTPSQPQLLRNREAMASNPLSRQSTPLSPISLYQPQRKVVPPLPRMQDQMFVKGSPLGRGMSVDTDSSLGTSPGSPTLVGREANV